MGSTIEVVLTIIGISFWILFPIGMFISVSHLDKKTDQVVRLEHLRHHPVEAGPVFTFDWHHPIIFFRRWLEH